MSLTDHQKNQILDAVAHYMGPDLRGKIMSELPLAYNAWVGREIMSVEKLSDAEARVRADEDAEDERAGIIPPRETLVQESESAAIHARAAVVDAQMKKIAAYDPVPPDLMRRWITLCERARTLGDPKLLAMITRIGNCHDLPTPRVMQDETIIAEEES